MAWFEVTLSRVNHTEDRPRNPFVGGLPGPNETVPVTYRTWTFEAKNRAEVERLLEETRKANNPQVRGFSLSGIKEVPAPTEGATP